MPDGPRYGWLHQRMVRVQKTGANKYNHPRVGVEQVLQCTILYGYLNDISLQMLTIQTFYLYTCNALFQQTMLNYFHRLLNLILFSLHIKQ